MAQAQQMLCRHSAACDVVVGDGGDAAAGQIPDGQNGGYFGGFALEQRPVPVAPGGDDQAVDPLGQQLVTHLGHLRRRVVGLGNDGEKVSVPQGVGDAPEHRANKRVTQIGDDDAYRPRSPPAQSRSLKVSPVTQFGGSSKNPGSGRQLDQRALVGAQRPRSSRDVNAGPFSHVLEGYVCHLTHWSQRPPKIWYGETVLTDPSLASGQTSPKLDSIVNIQATKRNVGPGPTVLARVPLSAVKPAVYHSGATDGSSALSAVTFTDGMNSTTRSLGSPVRTS